MTNKKYRPAAEGAVFDRRRTEPHTPEEVREILSTDPLRDRVSECEELALGVLRDHYGKPVGLQNGDPCVADNPLPWPTPGSVPEIVLDAFEILDLSRGIRSLESVVLDDRFSEYRVATIRNIANSMMALGKLFMVLSLRMDGIESEVFARVSQKENLQPRAKTAIDESKLREEWDRIKRIKPEATKQVWRESIAVRLGTSESTIKRRLAEFKIV
jgi:hypothetical protein